MTPSEVSQRLFRLAGSLDSSKTPNRSVVLDELRRLIAAMSPRLVITQVERSGGPDSFPDFLVHGEFHGEPFVREISVEVDGSGTKSRHVSGYDFETLADGADFDATSEDPVLMAVYNSPEYLSLL